MPLVHISPLLPSGAKRKTSCLNAGMPLHSGVKMGMSRRNQIRPRLKRPQYQGSGRYPLGIQVPVMGIKSAESQNCHCKGRGNNVAVGQLQVHATELLICIYSSLTTLFNPHLLCCRYVSLDWSAVCDRAGCVCSSAPCKVLNGGSRDEVITVWAVAGHHYDLITHNITTKYNYHTFIISRTDLK